MDTKSNLFLLKSILGRMGSAWEVKFPNVAMAWRSRPREGSKECLELYQKLGKLFLDRGELRLAFDVATEGLEIKGFENDPGLRQTRLLAKLRIGDYESAEKELEGISRLIELISSKEEKQELRGLIARTSKDAWERTRNSELLKDAFTQYQSTYQNACSNNDAIWHGINAATLAFLLGDCPTSKEIAENVKAICLELRSSGTGDYWCVATLAEAQMLLALMSASDSDARQKEAEQIYKEAVDLAGKSWSTIHSTRRNLKLILQGHYKDPDKGKAEAARIIPMPPIVIFTGHMIDNNRLQERFPSRIEGRVKEEIKKSLATLAEVSKTNVHFGYASGACGSDILFHEALQEQGGESHLLLPYNLKDFKVDSVDFVGGDEWGKRLDKVIENAAEVIYASEHRLKHGTESYEYVNQLLLGLAKMKSGELETDLYGLAVWEKGERGEAGGTLSNIDLWKKHGMPNESIHIIDTGKIREDLECRYSGIPRTTGVSISPPAKSDSKIMAILFSDIKAFSKLNEKQLPAFVEELIGKIAELCDREDFKDHIHVRNTWGDAIYLVFDELRSAGLFAIRLHETVCKFTSEYNDRAKKEEDKLPKEFNIRTGLHYGPVHFCDKDPITGSHNYFGTHVSKGARIEPIAEPGQIYASKELAAIATAENIKDFYFEYLGQEELPKGFGTFEIYLLKPETSIKE